MEKYVVGHEIEKSIEKIKIYQNIAPVCEMLKKYLQWKNNKKEKYVMGHEIEKQYWKSVKN